MTELIIILSLFGVVSISLIYSALKKRTTKNPIILPNDNNELTPPDSDPVGPGEIVIPGDVIPSDEEPIGEMPDKPLPINCQLAQFQPAPQDYFYIDCCGNPQKGDGFEPWEKRSPVAIDSNQPFYGMTLLDVEAEINC